MCLDQKESSLLYDGDDREPNQTYSQMMAEARDIQDLEDDVDDLDVIFDEPDDEGMED